MRSERSAAIALMRLLGCLAVGAASGTRGTGLGMRAVPSLARCETDANAEKREEVCFHELCVRNSIRERFVRLAVFAAAITLPPPDGR